MAGNIDSKLEEDAGVLPTQMAAILSQSTPLYERINACRQRDGTGFSSLATSAELRSTWQQVLGGEAAFQARMDHLRRNENTTGKISTQLTPSSSTAGSCDPIVSSTDQDHPHWAGILLESIELRSEFVGQPLEKLATHSFLITENSPSFAPAFVPFVVVARRRLRESAGKAVDALSPQAHTAIERELLFTLSHVATPTLQQEVELAHALTGPMPWSAPCPDERVKSEYALGLARGGWLDLFTIYPVLARLMSCRIERWLTHLQTFILHLPYSPLSDHVRDGLINNIKQDCGDSHDGGRTVMLIEGHDGRQIVYKARSLALENGFQSLLSCVNKCGFSHPLRVTGVVDAGNHGWMEFVPSASCREPGELQALNYRLGGLMCLLSFLQTTDIHYDNLILAGDQPVIVDLETLLHPRIDAITASGLGPGSIRMQQGGVCDPAWLENGFLPITANGASAPKIDFSLLGPSGPLKGRIDREKFIGGFKEMYLLVCENKLVIRQCVESLANAKGRAVLRSTFIYNTLLQQSLQPDLMRDGATRGIRFEVLRSAALREGVDDGIHAMLDAELEALENLDVPLFEHVVSEADLGFQSCPETTASPLAESLARLESAEPDRLAALTSEIEAALETCIAEESPKHE